MFSVYFYVFFIMNSVIGSLICLSSPSPLMMWVGMEISSFFFIPIIVLSSNLESGWKYFISQGLSSLVLFLGVVVGEMTSLMSKLMVFLSLMIKLTSFPFFGWSIHLSENLSWLSFFLLGSIQKIPPLIFLGKISHLFSCEMVYVSILTVSFLSIFFYFSFSIRWMLILSSFFNFGWLIFSASMGMSSTLSYLLVYLFLNFLVVGAMALEWPSFHSSMKESSSSWEENLLVLVSISALMGIPPLGTFWGKIEVIFSAINLQSTFIPLLFSFFSSLVCFFYVKLTFGKGIMPKKEFFFRASGSHGKTLSFMFILSFFFPLFYMF